MLSLPHLAAASLFLLLQGKQIPKPVKLSPKDYVPRIILFKKTFSFNPGTSVRLLVKNDFFYTLILMECELLRFDKGRWVIIQEDIRREVPERYVISTVIHPKKNATLIWKQIPFIDDPTLKGPLQPTPIRIMFKGSDDHGHRFTYFTQDLTLVEGRPEFLRKLSKQRKQETIHVKRQVAMPTALKSALINNQYNTVLKWIQHKEYLKSRDKHENTPLMLSIKNPKMMQLLIKNGADVNAIGDNGWTALMMVAAQDSPDIVSAEILVKAGAKVNQTNNNHETALLCACERGNSKIMRWLLKHGADANKGEDALGYTSLMFTAMDNLIDDTRILLTYKANYRATNKRGQTALDIAKEEGYTEVVSLLSKLK